MKKRLLLIALLIFQLSISQIYDDAIQRTIEKENFSAPDSLGNRVQLKSIRKKAKNATVVTNLPYPILFVHGLNSNSETWNTFTDFLDTQYGLVYGGRFDYCLNFNNNDALSNLNFYPTSGADIARFTSTLTDGDYYCLNFDVAIDGSFNPWLYDVLSSQSSIAKQGATLKRTIELILQLTGKEKVIVVGHSMGGLAIREYLQNASNWQLDNQHHIAKAVFSGVPHGGSNASASIMNNLAGIDSKSEAVRDLRTSYYYSGEPGVYLFGGNETATVMDDMLLANFYNFDVNCNTLTNENVQGLNQKPISTNLDFASIIANGFSATSDGVVSTTSANINTIYSNLTTNSFESNVIHTSLNNEIATLMKAVDEPNTLNLAYKIDLNRNYKGFTTLQANGNPVADKDYFKFEVLSSSNATITISNIVTNTMSAVLFDHLGQQIGSNHNSNSNQINFSENLVQGNYYLLVNSILPTTSNYLSPYLFGIQTTTLNTDTSLALSQFNIYPNPTQSFVNFDNSNTNFSSYTITNLLGEKIVSDKINHETKTISLENQSNGMYFLRFENETTSKICKVIKN